MLVPAMVVFTTLGIAIDQPTMAPKAYYIFDPDAINASLIQIPTASTKSMYRLIQSTAETTEFLNINGDLSIQAMQGQISLQGIGKYLIQTINRKKTIELLCTVYHETVTETFPSYTLQREEWRTRKQEQVGTHYIRSIVYGGLLVISYKIVVEKDEDYEEVNGAVTAQIENSGAMDANVAGTLEMINKDLGSKYKVEISAYATVGLINAPTNLAAVLRLIKQYPSLVKQINDGKGAPVKIDLQPISSIDPRFTEPKLPSGIDSILNQAMKKLEDLKAADRDFKAWDAQGLWDDRQQEMVNAYNRKLKIAYESMIAAITSMDAPEGIKKDHFDKAFKDYGENHENIPGKYLRELTKLKHEVENKPYFWYPYTTAYSYFIHWGSINCTLPSVDPVYVGYASSSPKGFGSGGDVLCLNIQPQMDPMQLSNNASRSYLGGLSYVTLDKETGPAYCAFCKLENASSVITVTGRSDCPPDMKFEYNGFLVTNQQAVSKPVCFDFHPDDKIVDMHSREDSLAGKLAPLWIMCDECDEDEAEEKARFISCAVCSR
ncbi:uncharacterized protein NPIL_278651 [Nephila pilipes]|uniref:MACPF domain-containing protein n=1 Tax=Nephila pilipes TaxID=299642 RepID=A0A8X6TWQ2_NEPPI|nr:uncharacterized protein NPIL_278651 [Nephila pilipes]